MNASVNLLTCVGVIRVTGNISVVLRRVMAVELRHALGAAVTFVIDEYV